jgi:hypothetical protein
MKKILLIMALMFTTSIGYATEEKHEDVGSRAIAKSEKMYLKTQNGNHEEQEEQEDRITSDVHYHHAGNIIHPGSLHRPHSVSAFGETVELEDGSIWSVSYGDRWKTLSWLRDDIITIVPNPSWFGTDFRMVNNNTGDIVDVDLRYGPVLGSIFTYKIVSIDYMSSIVYLQDSSWAISVNDETVIYSWQPGDTVIIGNNDGWNSSIRPHILINVNVNDYACANCMSF